MKALIESLESVIAELKKQNELAETISVLSDKFASLQAFVEDRLHNAPSESNRIDRLADELEQLEGKVEDIPDVSDLESRIEDLESQNGDLESRLDEVDGKVEDLESERPDDNLTPRVSEVEGKLEQTQNELKTIKRAWASITSAEEAERVQA